MKMQKCKFCGKEFDGNFCPACGKKAEENLCPRCKAIVSENLKFCPNCGQELNENAITQQVAQSSTLNSVYDDIREKGFEKAWEKYNPQAKLFLNIFKWSGWGLLPLR